MTLVGRFISPFPVSPGALARTYDPVTGQHIPGAKAQNRHGVFWVKRAYPGHGTSGARAVDIDARDRSGGPNVPVRAMASGTVLDARYAGNCGNMVRMEHAGGWRTKHCHLSRVDVAKGQRVSQGQQIGIQGCTGNCSGPHDHIEIYDPRTDSLVPNPLDVIGSFSQRDFALAVGITLGLIVLTAGAGYFYGHRKGR